MTTDISLCDGETMDRLAQMMLRGDAHELGRALQEAMAAYPHDARIYLLRGSLLASKDDFTGARSDLREAILLDPFLEEARFMLGYLEYTNGNVSEARALWKPLLGSAGSSPVSTLGWAIVSILDGNVTEARDALELALTLGPSEAIGSYIRRLLGELGESATIFEPSSDTSMAAHFLISDYLSNQTKH